MIVVVAGPPCSGKTTYVTQHASVDDPVLDWDAVWTEVTGHPAHDRDVPGREQAEQQTEAVFRARLATLTHGWVIRTAPTKQYRAILRRQKGARTLVLAIPASECVRRLHEDPSYRDKGQVEQAIYDWWARYQPSTSQDEYVVQWATQEAV